MAALSAWGIDSLVQAVAGGEDPMLVDDEAAAHVLPPGLDRHLEHRAAY